MDGNAPPQGAETEAQYIVGIGSSAGGLEALRELASSLPTELPVAYVVVQHMSPQHKSLLTTLVARESRLRVEDVTDGVVPAPNVIYVTPPNADVVMSAGKLRLLPPSPDRASPKPSVDRFLMSIADEKAEHAVGVILSGTGSDGAYGVQAIREAGGITISQDDASAKYDGMPNAAVETGCVDLVLNPHQIGTHLAKILSSPKDFGKLIQEQEAGSPVLDLLQILLARTRVDFRDYKQSTVQRRIERRMIALGINSQIDYTTHCRSNPSEVDALFKDLLISVTRFFRDSDEFEHLSQALREQLDPQSRDSLRIWVAGCATGEEAYTIAIILAELLGGPQMLTKDRIQIFATDIDENALRIARQGHYSLTALNDVPDDLANQYFTRSGDRVQVIEALRSVILFSNHNLCNDPPFQRIDLVCCRNLLIYFGNTLQTKVLTRLHYAMRDSALLFLGTAESAFGSEDLFIPVGKNLRIFRKRTLKNTWSRAPLLDASRHRISSVPEPAQTAQKSNVDRLLFDSLAKSLADNSLLISDDLSIMRVYGDVSRYIELREGNALQIRLNLLKSPLREEARSLLTLALKHNSRRTGVKHLLAKDGDDPVQLEAIPIHAKGIDERAVLLTFTHFQATRSVTLQTGNDDEQSENTHGRVADLEKELSSTREALQQTIEELETSNEELQSLNEELQSTNEELQATNEELETANEELQSTNEELITVNEELQVNSAELSAKTNELSSVLEHAPSALLMVNEALQIAEASAAARVLFDLSERLDRPHVSQCRLPPDFPQLAPICDDVLRLGKPTAAEFVSRGTHYQLNCAPFYDQRGRLCGVTLVVSEFPELARSMDMLLDNAPFLVMWRRLDGRILRISNASARTLNLTRSEAEGRNLYDVLDPVAAKQVRDGDNQTVASPNQMALQTFPVMANGGKDVRWLSTQRFVHNDPLTDEPAIYAFGTDVTEVVEVNEQLTMRNQQLEMAQRSGDFGIWEISVRDRRVFWSDEAFSLYGYPNSDTAPTLEMLTDLLAKEDADHLQSIFDGQAEPSRGMVFYHSSRGASSDAKSLITKAQVRYGPTGDAEFLFGIVHNAVEEP